MESANLHLHHHQLQEQLVGCYSLADQPGHKVSGTHHWNPSFLLNQNITTNNGYHSESISTSGGFLWPPPVSSLSSDRLTQQSPSELLLASIKDETSASFPKLSEMRHGPSNAEDSPLLSIKHQPIYSHDQNLRLNDFSYLQQELSARDLYPNDPESVSLRSAAACSRYSFGHFVPTSDFYSSLVSSCSPNLVALHGLSSTYDGGSPGQSSNENLGKLKEAMFMGSNHMPEKDKLSSCSSIKEKLLTHFDSKISALVSGGTRFKRPGSFPDSVESGGESKKCRSTARSSCPPLKVRKEKLGDRIAALQKLVAPFGKTDTASVLTEAIGYIQFLHDQVQTLSVPYMKQPHRPCRTKLAGSSKEQEKEEPMPDLRSRGLCLVPLSCASLFNIYSDSFYTTP